MTQSSAQLGIHVDMHRLDRETKVLSQLGIDKDKPCILQIFGPASFPDMIIFGAYLHSYDPEARGGLGDFTFTLFPEKAMTFPTLDACFAEIMRSPTCRPIREDGKPNRPLTAFHLRIEAAPQHEEEANDGKC